MNEIKNCSNCDYLDERELPYGYHQCKAPAIIPRSISKIERDVVNINFPHENCPTWKAVGIKVPHEVKLSNSRCPSQERINLRYKIRDMEETYGYKLLAEEFYNFLLTKGKYVYKSNLRKTN